MIMDIVAFRLGHRIKRDERLSTHVALAARALGCSGLVYSGQRDTGFESSVMDVVDKWGGDFKIRHSKNWKKEVGERKIRGFFIIHLTIYGVPLLKNINKIRKRDNVLLIVGGEKVPPDVYQLADLNIAVSSQPHSEVAALAVFLHEYFKGKELEKGFRDAKLRVIPQERGKKAIKL